MSPAVRFAAGVCWANDAAQTVVVHAPRQAVYYLTGEEMAVWDWLALGYPPQRVARLLAVLRACPLPEAQACLAEMLRTWLASGLLEHAGG